MNNKPKVKGALLTALVLVIIYFFFFPALTGKEYIVKEDWKIDLADKNLPVKAYNNQVRLTGFRVNKKFGYIDAAGNLYYSGDIQYNLTYSDYGFINYSSIQTQDQHIVMFSPDGNFLKTLQAPGFPMLSEDGGRLFLFNTNGSGVSEMDDAGAVSWSLSSNKIITCFSAGKENVCIGFANGLVQVYNNRGEIVYELLPSKSRIPVIAGCAINWQGDKIALVSGIDPQFLVYIEKGEKRYKEPLYFNLNSDFRREVFIKFSNDSKYLFIENKDKIIHFEIKNKKAYIIPVTGELVSISLGDKEGFFSVLSKSSTGTYRLELYKPVESRIFMEEFISSSVFNKLLSDDLLLSVNQTLLKLNIREM